MECKGTEGHGPSGHSDVPATPPSLLPQLTLGHHSLGTCSGQARLSGWLAWTGDEVRQQHRQLRVAKKLQQEFGKKVARIPQEHPGWARRPQERPQATQEWAQAAAELQEKPWVAAEP